MKKIVSMAISIALVIFLSACGGGRTAPAAEPSATAPEEIHESTPSPESQPVGDMAYQNPKDLLGETYDPFYAIDFPDTYTKYQFSLEEGEYNLYALYLTAEDTAQNVVTYLSTLVGDCAEDSIAENLADLESGGVDIHGTQTEEGLNADVEIRPTDPDNNRYEYVEGYDIRLITAIDPYMMEGYAAILDMNFNTDAIDMAGAEDFLAAAGQPVYREMKIGVGSSPFMEAQCVFQPADYDSWRSFFFSDGFTEGKHDERDDNGTQVHCDYGQIHTIFVLSDADRRITIRQSLNEISQNMAVYMPEQTLSVLGFQAGPDGNWGYNDTDRAAFVSITKTIWGGDGDYIIMLMNNDFDVYRIDYYPEAGRYSVNIVLETASATHYGKYYYDTADGSLTPMDEGWDEQGVRENMAAIFPDTDDPILAPITTFDTYMQDTFGMDADALWVLPAE